VCHCSTQNHSSRFQTHIFETKRLGERSGVAAVHSHHRLVHVRHRHGGQDSDRRAERAAHPGARLPAGRAKEGELLFFGSATALNFGVQHICYQWIELSSQVYRWCLPVVPWYTFLRTPFRFFSFLDDVISLLYVSLKVREAGKAVRAAF